MSVISLVIYLIILPVAALAVVFLFALSVRIASGLFGGKAGLVREWQAIAPAAGSAVVMSGIIGLVLFTFFSWLYQPGTAEILAGPTNAFLILGLLYGIIAAQAAFFINAAYGLWLENLTEVEHTHNTRKILALATALIAFIAVAAVFFLIGLNIENQLSAVRAQLG